MAEINTSHVAGGKAGGRRSKKLSTKVDLTPMVDLGFLLITFFIFTTTMSESKAMKLFMPDDSNPKIDMTVAQSTALTVIPLADNKIFYYHGELNDALQSKSCGITTFSERDGLGKIVRNKQAALDKMGPGKRKELMLMIKPSPESNYESVVNALDEALINDVKRYAILDITPEEKNVAAAKSVTAQ
ncbi:MULTISPECIES: ExbD/TolR family protein [Niastella]|uniref:Biopolymer transporter ExbD n=1 Tax=Niastella soli TaxID=2821487 RepID=A0ABS3YPR1_9BACT|nr:biopolymer transporter ExbD [Niastella soli]MBO9199813.1 biopolymer transporter ExbD [Niastella soli]